MDLTSRSSIQFVLSFPPTLPDSWDSVVLPIDKPGGITSYGVIRSLKRTLAIRKIGHAGTLDPLATGLLICMVGRATKSMRQFLEAEKTYEGTMRLGETTESFDSDTPIVCRRETDHVTRELLEKTRERFLGTIIQDTPIYSAVRVGGERLYKKARRGEKVRTPKRVVSIYEFTLGKQNGDDLEFSLTCSTGTYVRSIVHEFGHILETGAHLTALRRTRIGDISVENSWTLDRFVSDYRESRGHTISEQVG